MQPLLRIYDISKWQEFPGKGPSASLLRMKIMNSFASPTGRIKFFKCKEYIHSSPLTLFHVYEGPTTREPSCAEPPTSVFSHYAAQYVFETCNRHRKGVWLRKLGNLLSSPCSHRLVIPFPVCSPAVPCRPSL